MAKQEREKGTQPDTSMLDETLYEARRIRGTLRVLADVDEIRIASYGYHELLQLVYLTRDAIEQTIKGMEEDIIDGLLAAGATDSMIQPIQRREDSAAN